MSDSYTEQLEMQLRFAEEEAQERERNAYHQGKAEERTLIISIIEEIRDCGLWCMHDMCDKDNPTSYECEKCALTCVVKRLKEQKNEVI